MNDTVTTPTITAPIDDEQTSPAKSALDRAASFSELVDEIGGRYRAALEAPTTAERADHLRIARVLASVAQAEIDIADRARR